MILFFGDYAPETKRFLSNRFKNYLKKVQYIVLNYEGTSSAIYNKKLKKLAKGYAPLINDELIVEMLRMGKNVICNLANNHYADYGKEGYLLTVQHLKKIGCNVIGPETKKGRIFSNYKVYKDKLNINIVSASDPNPGEVKLSGSKIKNWRFKDAYDYLRKIKNNDETKIFYFHSGVEFVQCPNPSLVRKIEKIYKTNCDYVLVHHQHIPLPIYKKNKTIVAFGLGQIAFDYLGHKKHNNTNVGIGFCIDQQNKHMAFDIVDHGSELDLIVSKKDFLLENRSKYTTSIFNKDWARAAYLRISNKDLIIKKFNTKEIDTKNVGLINIINKYFKTYYIKKLINMLCNEAGRDILLGSIYYIFYSKFFFKK